jgi:hypothetical protein
MSKQKYNFHFHNMQGAWLESVVSTSRAGAWKQFRKTWDTTGVTVSQGSEA